MRMMSWSRYHFLTRLLQRAVRQRRALRINRIRLRRSASVRTGAPSSPAPGISALADCSPTASGANVPVASVSDS
jgi:hypothetical protein